MEILIPPLFACSLFSADSVILLENLDVYMEVFLKIPCVFLVTAKQFDKLNIHNYLN